MIMTDLETIIDGDGHLVEDLQGIADRMPSEIRRKYLGTTGTTLTRLFPPLDHFHSANPIETPPNSFAQVGYDGWLDFAEDLGIDSAVLYPTTGLSFGQIVNRDWAIALAADAQRATQTTGSGQGRVDDLGVVRAARADGNGGGGRTVPLGSVDGVPSPQDPRQLVTNRGEERVRVPVTATKEPGRNEPCPCGSGIKYKKCHGRA